MHTQSRRSCGLARSVGVLLVFVVLAGCGSNTGTSVALGPSSVGEALTAGEEAELQALLQMPASSALAVESLVRRASDKGEKAPLCVAALRKLEEAATPAAVSALKFLALNEGADAETRLLAQNAAAALVRTPGAEARDGLAAVLAAGSAERRELVVKLIGHAGTSAHIPLLTPVLSDPAPVVRVWALEAKARLEAR
ncbi:MAG: hypothetical protein HY722_04055 [Planctomycetes bacterium]|nr:hypothetical protein [Planctomycetota bacterium]